VGLNLSRVSFEDWVEDNVPRRKRPEFYERFFQHVGQHLDMAAWLEVDSDSEPSPKVASYTGYGIFVDCVRFLTKGDYGEELEDWEEFEHQALVAYREALQPNSLQLAVAAQFTEVGASDAIYVPASFESPFSFDVVTVASKVGALATLQGFAQTIGFDITSEAEPELVNEQWLPISTAKNIARLINRYFAEKPNMCIAFT
jgi:hypothetical protein